MSRNDQFGDQHARIEGMFDQLNQDLNERRRLLRGGANTTKINMELRKKQSTLGTEISALEEQLSKDDRSGKITRKEATRRADMIRALHNKKHKLDDVVSNSSDQSSRDGLFKKHGGANQRKQYDEEDETDSTRGLDNQQLVQMQRDTMDNQDKDLESLSAAIARQKHLGYAISDELDLQQGLLEDVDEEMGNATARLKKTTKQVRKISKKEKNCGMITCLVFLIALFIALVATKWGCTVINDPKHCK
eukprot:TRINITY_DN839_c0_g2_i3.p1 TRINITY_DN839_c0_g2~~TRINITY_DN839_c0_g2_i3.p1  ORF type:complete len:248 (+),score=78.24 TRINITY_DN839_c0_g2_i3:100-843(+)